MHSVCVQHRENMHFLSKPRITEAVSKHGDMPLTRPEAHGEKLCGSKEKGWTLVIQEQQLIEQTAKPSPPTLAVSKYARE